MSQHDLDISTADANSGITVRNAMNLALQALGNLQKGASAPGTTYSCMLWADSTSGLLKMRNQANSDWIIIGSLDTLYLGLASLTAANEFTATQHLDGDALLFRYRDTGGGGIEYGIRSDGGKLEICENLGTEGTPDWAPRVTVFASNGLYQTKLTEPELVLPTLQDYTNANHSHINPASGGLLMKFEEKRSQFVYNGGVATGTVKMGSGQYYCKDKFAWWDAELTSTAQAFVAADAGDWFYLYLDYSAIGYGGVEITNSKIIWSKTAPAYNQSYRGWYNGEDRCIFAVLCNSAYDNFEEFFHVGDYVQFADGLATNAADLNLVTTTWTDVNKSIGDYSLCPVFSCKAELTFKTDWVNAAATISWRTNGQTGSTGHLAVQVPDQNVIPINTTAVITDNNGLIEVYENNASNNLTTVNVEGWYFGVGI